jgi:hypothetical protein
MSDSSQILGNWNKILEGHLIMNLTSTIYMFSGLGLVFNDGTGTLKALEKKCDSYKIYYKCCILLNPMVCGTFAREQELQRAILTTLHKIGFLIIGIKNMSTF